ncbi:MAG: sigma-70 family RNA polymerase sigma factor [Candidatus Poribacteria bacterium]|nr:sigma-70 family RNA polymerase sigma factor [Candidatus Poribacteria bacterium]
MKYNQEDDALLINRILSGDDHAFNTLVQKYQKGIHALAWRKIGDFHYAEEITQDIFLQAYKNLSTLKNPNQFAGWLYVIADRLCINWRQRNKSAMQLLEDTPTREIDRSSYNRYLSEQRETEAIENRYDRVKKLLANLPESERTVISLYYLGEMTTKEIGKFLGVSVNTITSRLQRARKRLQEDHETLIQEVLNGVHISTGLTQNIMRQVADIKPTPSPGSKPFLPWMAFGTAVVFIALLLGTSNRYLVRFQKPYSFEAKSEPIIEIIDAPITLNINSKPAVRNQTGRAAISSENGGVGLQTSESVLARDLQVSSFRPSISQWTQTSGPQKSPISEIFVTSKGYLYVAASSGIYSLIPGATAWTPINRTVSAENSPTLMAEHGDTLYIIANHEVFASTDNGEMWSGLGSHPKGHPVGFIIRDETQWTSMYLALRDNGIFHSTDGGKQWVPMNNGLTDKQIYAVAAIGNTVFTGTNRGLYRLNSDVWEQVPVNAFNPVCSLAATENNLYIATEVNPFVLGDPESTLQIVTKDAASPWKIFHSIDLGVSWTDITPKNKSSVMTIPNSIKILVTGKTLFVFDNVVSFRSNDGGQTWTDPVFNTGSVGHNFPRAVAPDDNTFYKAGALGVYRTIDDGASWHPFMKGITGTWIQSLRTFNDKLYVHTGNSIVQSTDGGESWKNTRVNVSQDAPESTEHLYINLPSHSKLVVADRELFAIVSDGDNLNIFRLSTNDNIFIPVQGIPSFNKETLSMQLVTTIAEAEQTYLPDDMKMDPKLAKFAISSGVGGFAVSDGTFYAEYYRRLFKWKPGNSEWTNTGLIDLGKQPKEDLQNGFKLAVSGESIYIGKRTGRLFQSLDSGNSWRDITPNLPLYFTRFNEITFIGLTVYVATDKGVLASQNGESWYLLTNRKGMPIVVDRFAVDHTTIYGAGDTGVYRLDTRRKWQLISPSVPDKILSLVINNNNLYIATQHRGIFHISIGTEPYNKLSQK